jgi:hypothetical protein
LPTAGYSSKCKTCNSARRLEIEAWHEDGIHPEAIEARLAKLGERISHAAIRNHLVSHYNVQEAAKAKYYESQQQLEKAAVARLSDIEILDSLIQDNNIIHTGLRKQIADLGNKFSVPMPAVTMLNGVATEICRAMKTKQDLLGESAIDKVASAIESLSEDELNARIAKLIPISKD